MKKILLFTFTFHVFAFLLFPFYFVYAQTNTYTFTLTWQDNATNEDGQYIYRDGTQIGKVGPNITTYKDTVTAPVGSSICYEVSAYNAVAESAKSDKSCMAMPAPKPVAPSVPTGLTTSAISTTIIRISWADNSDNETGFEIARRQWSPKGVTLLPVAADLLTYDDKGRVKNKTYCYQIKAKGIVADSEYSNESCATTPLK